MNQRSIIIASVVVVIVGIAVLVLIVGERYYNSTPVTLDTSTVVIQKPENKTDETNNKILQNVSRDTITYRNEQFLFTLELPKNWEGYYTVSMHSTKPNEGALVLFYLPVEIVKGLYDVSIIENGWKKLAMFGINVYPKAAYDRDQALCQKNKVKLDDYDRKATLGKPFKIMDGDSDLIFICSHLNINNLGNNEKFYYYYLGIEGVDNPLKSTDISKLKPEVDTIVHTLKFTQ